MKKHTRYPSYDVMNEQDEWDDHTQEIVISRLSRDRQFQYLSHDEIELLKRVCSRLVGDEREDLLLFIVGHIDQSLNKGIGEGQRKVGLPKAQDLIRTGIAAVNHLAKQRFLFDFIALNEEQQRGLLQEISLIKKAEEPEWKGIPPADFFTKLMGYTIEAYCSHPVIWSEMGYGGPAYPRGYVRTQMGQLDPWEAQPE